MNLCALFGSLALLVSTVVAQGGHGGPSLPPPVSIGGGWCVQWIPRGAGQGGYGGDATPLPPLDVLQHNGTTAIVLRGNQILEATLNPDGSISYRVIGILQKC